MLIDGIYTPVITPFQEDGTVDSVAYGEQLEYLVAMGVDCIVVGGTTGESYAQTLAERAELMKLTADVIGRRLPLMAGVGSTRTEDSISLALVARECGIGSLLLASPPYALPTDKENAIHALRIDRAGELPIMLYNYPQRTGTNMGPEYLSRVSRSPRFQAIKESSGEIDRVHMLAREYPHLALACGADDQALEFFAWGARMWVCAGSNFLAREHIALYEACAVKGDFELGRRIMKAMLPLMKALEGGGKLIQGVKFGVQLVGQSSGFPRPPLRPLTKDEKRELERIISSTRIAVAVAIEEGAING